MIDSPDGDSLMRVGPSGPSNRVDGSLAALSKQQHALGEVVEVYVLDDDEGATVAHPIPEFFEVCP